MSKRSKLLGSYSSFKPQNKFKTKIIKTLRIVIIFFLAYQFITFFLVSSFIVKTSAMEPEILQGQRILTAPIISGTSLNFINIRIPGLKDPGRGDIILVKPGNSDKIAWYILSFDTIVRFFTLQKVSINSNINQNWNNQHSVKRIIGIPGDTVQMVDYNFLIKPINKSGYISEKNLIEQEYIIQIPENIIDAAAGGASSKANVGKQATAAASSQTADNTTVLFDIFAGG